ncbi:MAG: hypothetical protein JWR19_2222 [Pedosphaera sp.]|nr:hypothetical protein [Pedosphaera sp.]
MRTRQVRAPSREESEGKAVRMKAANSLDAVFLSYASTPVESMRLHPKKARLRLLIYAMGCLSLAKPAFGQQSSAPESKGQLAQPEVEAQKPPVLGSVTPEKLPPFFADTEYRDWLQARRVDVYGWVEGGYTYSSAGSGLLANAPTPNRFGNQFLFNAVWLIIERKPLTNDWSWGFRSDFYAGSDAALLRPQNGFGPTDPRFGTDFRQLYLSLHMPALSEGGVDLLLGRQNVQIGYETLMAPYRPMYSETYFWIHYQVGSTAATATWHATDQLDIMGSVILGFNTFFSLRGSSPCYLAKAIYSLDPEKQTTVSAAVYTGPEPFPVATGHLGSWQTGAGAGVKHNWSRRLTQEFLVYGSWDFNDPAVNRTSPAYGCFTILTYHLNQHLDLNGRGEWFYDRDGARTGVAATFGEVTGGLNVMPNKWINFRPEIRGDFASKPAFGAFSSSNRERSELTVAFDVILKFR